MITKPRLKSYLTIFPLSDASWGLRGGSDELWRIKLRDDRAFSVFSATLPFLDGRHTTTELLETVSAQGVEREEVEQLLERLTDASLLEEADEFGLSEEDREEFGAQLSFFSRHTTEGGAKYQARLAGLRLAVVGGGLLGRTLARQLAGSGFGEVTILADSRDDSHDSHTEGERWRERIVRRSLDRERIWPGNAGPPPDLILFAQDAEDPQLLEALNDVSESQGIPWMLVRALESTVGWVGPLFVPGETSSYRDLEARVRSNLSFFPEYQAFNRHLRERRQAGAACGGLFAFFELLGSIAVIEAIKYLSHLATPQLAGRFLTIDLSSWNTETHDVLRVPRLGLEATEPAQFAWKEMPHDEIDEHRDSEIFARRS